MKNTDKNVGKIIKDTISQKGISNSELAKKIGVSKQTLWNWLSNDDLSIKKICTISEAIGYDLLVPFLLDSTLEKLSGESSSEPKITIQIEVDPLKNNEVLEFIKEQKLYNLLNTKK